MNLPHDWILILKRNLLALAIGSAGAGIAMFLKIPLAPLIGAMAAVLAANRFGLDVFISPRLRIVIIMVVGAFLGSKFTPEVFTAMALWPWSLLAVTLYVPIATALATLYFMRVTKQSPVTSFFSAVPGGVVAMIAIGTQLGGNTKSIIISQSFRVIFAVIIVPVILVEIIPGENIPMVITEGTLISWKAAGLVAMAAIFGALAGQKLRIPAAHIIGPLFASGLLFATGAVEGELPSHLLNACLVVMGTALGGLVPLTSRRELLLLSLHTLVVMIFLIALSGLFAIVLTAFLPLDPLAVLLAFAPGGLVEMSAIALSLDLSPQFVSAHHIVRILLCFLGAPLAAHLMQKRLAKSND